MNPLHDSHVVIHTDGSTHGKNPGPGGWSAVYHTAYGDWECSGGYERSTSSRMELLAAIHALEGVSPDQDVGPFTDVDVVTDSQYLCRGANEWLTLWSTNGWVRADGKPVANIDLWQRLVGLKLMHHRVTFHWIKGHAGDPRNERADQLAAEASASGARPVDRGYEAR